ncbi:ferric iron reductase protein FhuF [Paenibacillus sp. V4I9]|uniref:hypothetical protein n=1 Tax=Paenibacillus sp. V4I9 TaxID=3042308 RepID=UPI002786D1D5|nr:hypothetical protein [Paenibacillus sp. V4I9]MDQ0889040.1 ferric iron reductase protein FhuF [Paenibacillus sp. V4I9]
MTTILIMIIIINSIMQNRHRITLAGDDSQESQYLWFGEKAENPLICRFRQVKIPMHDDRHILLREKCCLNYCLPGGDRYCYTCPLITDERRIEKYLAAH